jgi:hypothetical protein
VGLCPVRRGSGACTGSHVKGGLGEKEGEHAPRTEELFSATAITLVARRLERTPVARAVESTEALERTCDIFDEIDRRTEQISN